MPTIEELRLTIEQLRQQALQLITQLRSVGGNERKLAEEERARDQDIIQKHLDAEAHMAGAARLARVSAKREKAIEEMTHKERIKELASKTGNMSILAFKAERGEEEEDKRIGALLNEIVAEENDKIKEETEIDAIFEQLQKDLQSLKTDPRAIGRLNPAGKAENLKTWARIHAALQRLTVLEQDAYLKQHRLARLRQEVLPMLQHEKDTNAKITQLLDWLRNAEDQERLLEEEDEKKMEEGTADVGEMREAA